MLGLALAMAFQTVPAPPPPADPERIALGRRLAETGTLATLLPLMAEKETADIVAAHPDLSAAEQADLRAEAARQFAAGREWIMAAEAQAFARTLDLPTLRTLVTQAEGEPARRLRAAMPGVIMATMQAMQGLDFKGDVLTAFCARTGKACPR